jgi:hypothetical protein
LKHYSIRTERTYCEWIRRYVHFHHMTSREEMVPAEPKMEEFLSDLAVKGEVAVSRQNQAFNALLFVYREVLHVQIGQIDSVRATRPARVPTVLTAQEARQERFLNALWDQVAEIHDLHFGPPQGTFFTKANPLTLPSRFGELKPKRKKP